MNPTRLTPLYNDRYTDESIRVAYGFNTIMGWIVHSVYPITGPFTQRKSAQPKFDFQQVDKYHIRVTASSPNFDFGDQSIVVPELVRHYVSEMLPSFSKSFGRAHEINTRLQALQGAFINHETVTIRGSSSGEITAHASRGSGRIDRECAIILLQTYIRDVACMYLIERHDASLPFEICLEYAPLQKQGVRMGTQKVSKLSRKPKISGKNRSNRRGKTITKKRPRKTT